MSSDYDTSPAPGVSIDFILAKIRDAGLQEEHRAREETHNKLPHRAREHQLRAEGLRAAAAIIWHWRNPSAKEIPDEPSPSDHPLE